jgi:Flp pilus assembly secretin CpaC
MGRRVRELTATTVAGVLVGALSWGSLGLAREALAQAPGRLYVTVDRSQMLTVPDDPVTKVSIANPNIADVQVLTPAQLIVNGKAVGVTSLILVSAKGVRQYELVVQARPILVTATPSQEAERHGVVVQRAERLSEQMFWRDKDGQWVELGTVKVETEAKK